jgi:hypothetical protein
VDAATVTWTGSGGAGATSSACSRSPSHLLNDLVVAP